VTLATMKIVGPAAMTNGLISKLQNATVEAASNMFKTAANAHEIPRAPLSTHPPQNIATPITIKMKPSRRPKTNTPKPDAPKIKPTTTRKTPQKNTK